MLAVAAAILTLCATAQADHLSCGDVITEDTRLDADIVGCPTNGLVIAADGVTLDLRGHTIQGERFDWSEGDGISSDGYDDLVIRNGTVNGFETAVGLQNASNTKVREMNVGGLGGLRIVGDNNVVERSITDASYFGLGVRGDNNLIRRNTIRSAEGAASVRGDGNVVVGNRIEGRFGGLSLAIDNGLVKDNVSDGAFYGYEIEGTNTLIIRNVASENLLFGFYVGSESQGIVLERNLATGAGKLERRDGTGISVASPTTALIRNTADDNGAYGIYVQSSAIDGGRNRASGNGIADCVSIRCR